MEITWSDQKEFFWTQIILFSSIINWSGKSVNGKICWNLAKILDLPFGIAWWALFTWSSFQSSLKAGYLILFSPPIVSIIKYIVRQVYTTSRTCLQCGELQSLCEQDHKFWCCATILMVRSKPNQEIGNFFSGSKSFHYKKGETILRSGEPLSSIFYLKKGYCRVYSISKTGEELTLIIFRPGDFFPTMSILLRPLNTYYIEAMTQCELLRISREKFLVFIKNNPEVHLELTKRILVRFGGVLQRMEHLVFGNAGAKIASMILICADRFGIEKDHEIDVQVPLTHADIASLVGLTRETTSIEIKKLENLKLIGYRGRHLVVTNKRGLKAKSLLD